MSDRVIVSGSGDRSMKIWNAETGELMRTFENHHGRGYALLTRPHSSFFADLMNGAQARGDRL